MHYASLRVVSSSSRSTCPSDIMQLINNSLPYHYSAMVYKVESPQRSASKVHALTAKALSTTLSQSCFRITNYRYYLYMYHLLSLSVPVTLCDLASPEILTPMCDSVRLKIRASSASKAFIPHILPQTLRLNSFLSLVTQPPLHFASTSTLPSSASHSALAFSSSGSTYSG